MVQCVSIFEGMKLKGDIIIADEKFTDYLLKWRPISDKSRFLASAGYTLENWKTLKKDLEEQILRLEAEWQDEDEYGIFYAIKGNLLGPNGKNLFVRTIWMKEHSTGKIRFVTLIPK